MPHIYPDFKFKKEFKQAIKDGKRVEVFGVGPFDQGSINGRTVVEAPADYHRWYAQVDAKDGVVVKVIN